jgi:hypothetical protein
MVGRSQQVTDNLDGRSTIMSKLQLRQHGLSEANELGGLPSAGLPDQASKLLA